MEPCRYGQGEGPLDEELGPPGEAAMEPCRYGQGEMAGAAHSCEPPHTAAMEPCRYGQGEMVARKPLAGTVAAPQWSPAATGRESSVQVRTISPDEISRNGALPLRAGRGD